MPITNGLDIWQRPLKANEFKSIVISLNLSLFRFFRKCIIKDDYFCIAYLLLSRIQIWILYYFTHNLRPPRFCLECSLVCCEANKALKRPIEYNLNLFFEGCPPLDFVNLEFLEWCPPQAFINLKVLKRGTPLNWCRFQKMPCHQYWANFQIQSSRVQVQVSEYRSPTNNLFIMLGSQVQVQVPKRKYWWLIQ